MATLKRGDILRKNQTRGRPPKPEKERQQKQRQAYQWRDARRVYLAASFERWRKLRARLQLKDSSLAWHLLETHDKGCDKCTKRNSEQGHGSEGGASSVMDVHVQPEKDASKFFPGVKAALRQLCHAHLQFEDCVELVGLICVEIDHHRKDNFSLQEVVRRATHPKARTHERDQSELEASQAQQVAEALSRQEMSAQGHDGMDMEVETSNRSQTVSQSPGQEQSGSGSHTVTAEHQQPSEKAGVPGVGVEDRQGSDSAVNSCAKDNEIPDQRPVCSESQGSSAANGASAAESHNSISTDLVPHQSETTSSDQSAQREQSDMPHIVSRNDTEGANTTNTEVHKQSHNSDECGHSDTSIAYNTHAGDAVASQPAKSDPSAVPNTMEAHISSSLAADYQTTELHERQQNQSVESYSPYQQYQTDHSQHLHAPAPITTEPLTPPPPPSRPHAPESSETMISRSREHYPVSRHSYTPEPGSVPRVVVSPEGVVHVPRASGATREVYRIDLSGESMTPRESVVWSASSDADPTTDPRGVGATSQGTAAWSYQGAEDGEDMSADDGQDESDDDTDDSRAVPTNADVTTRHAGDIRAYAMEWEGAGQAPPMDYTSASNEVSASISSSLSATNSLSQSSARHASSTVIAHTATSASAADYTPHTHTEHKREQADGVLASNNGGTGARMSAEDSGDVPLDMSVVKEEVTPGYDGSSQYTDTARNVRSASVPPDTGVTGASSLRTRRLLSPSPRSSSSERATYDSMAKAAAGVSQAESALASSTVQLLQNYTERLMQQRLSTDIASHLSARLAEEGGGHGAASRKRRLSEAEDRVEGPSGASPWPRKDMTQKPEYQFLETDPFIDFGEMSRFYPGMQQRTFYRWKRRIKDQIIFLEQRPHLTYAQFSAFFPHVKENVFHHWKGLIARGQRFLADSTKTAGGDGSSPMLDTGQPMRAGAGGAGSAREGEERAEAKDDHTTQYIFLQKNLGLDFEQFAQIYPDVTRPLFHTWKKQILSDFLKLQANPQISYQEFRKQAPVTQEVFTLWKTQVALLNGSPVTSSCLGLTPNPLSTIAPTLPPMSLLAARHGVKGMGAELAAWYSSYAPLMGLHLWPPLGMMAGASLATSTLSSGLRELGETDRDRASLAQANSASADREREAAAEKEEEVDDGNVSQEEDVTVDGEPTSLPHTLSPAPEGGAGGTGYRGRRQSLKPEHYHFLLHPDTSYAALSRIYPGVSVQRYGRWRRKVASALALLERQPHCTAEQFALYFPNVPDEVLESWRQRVKQGLAQLPLGSLDTGAESSSTAPPTSPAGGRSRDSSLSTDNVAEDMPNFLLDGGDGARARGQEAGATSTPAAASATRHVLPSGAAARKQVKLNREEYLFVQRYPKADFATFAAYYPTVSIRTFYRWRRHVREGISLLRNNPSISGSEFRKAFPEVSDEILEMWRVLVREEEGVVSGEQLGESYSDQEEQVDVTGVSGTKSPASAHLSASPGPTQADLEREETGRCRAEQWLLHMNPYLEYAEFARTYPGVPQRTFYRWKQEVQHVMHYMRTHPDVRYDDIAAVLPDISRDAFLVWRQLIAVEARNAQNQEERGGESSGTKSSAAVSDALHHHRSATVTSETENDAEQTTERRNESPASSGGQRPPELASDVSRLSTAQRMSEFSSELSEDEGGGSGKGRRQVRDEFVHLMLNRTMDYAEFAVRFGTVSQRTFYRWRRHIREWRAQIRANPDLDYATFSRTARDVPEHVFRVWKEWERYAQHEQFIIGQNEGHGASQHSVGGAYTGEEQTGRETIVATSSAYPVSSQAQSIAGISTEDVSVDADSGDSHGDENSDNETHQLAYQYFLRQPEMTYEDLAAHFPTVAERTFYSWKKSAEMKLEYIRSIRSTNFADFHGLFPDVPEDVFIIWKAKVLSEPRPGDNFLFPVGDEAQSMSLAGYTAESAAYTSTLKQQDSQESDSNNQRSPDPTPPIHPAFGAALSQPVREGVARVDPRATPTPTGHESEASNSESGVVSVKREVDTTPLPSFTETVSNLSRLSAMLHHHLPQHAPPPVHPHLLAASAVVNPHTSVITGTPGLANFSTALAGVVGRTLAESTAAKSLPPAAQPHPVPAQSAPEKTTGHADTRTARATSEARAAHEEKGEGNAYSSQRQRKMHRVEYMFVEKSPDVDVQEFLRHFPGVSPRTFYRWKREIREEQQANGKAS